MIVRILLTLVVWIPLVAQAEDAAKSASAFSAEHINSTDLSGNLKKLEQYYARVNQQLDKRLNRTQRDPFADTSQTRAPAPPAKTDLFVPQSMKQSRAAQSSNLPAINRNNTEDNGIPRMQFRGFIRMDNQKAGLLNIDGLGTFVVKEGDKVGLQQMTNDTVVRIVEINPLNLIIEFGNLGEKVVIQ